MLKVNITVTVITLNEEKDLPSCLGSVAGLADEIVVVDSGSTDKTLDIAKKYQAKIFYRKFDNYSNQKNYAAAKASGEWMLSMDADEVITEELADEIKEAVKNKEYDAYLIPRKNILLGKEIKYTRWSPDKHVWLWKKMKGEWKGRVHEEVEVNGIIGELKNHKIHYSYKTVADFLEMMNSYTDLIAEEKILKGKKFSYLRMFIDPAVCFFRRFIYKKGFLDGWRGFVLSYLMAIYRLTVWIKVWAKQHAYQ